MFFGQTQSDRTAKPSYAEAWLFDRFVNDAMPMCPRHYGISINYSPDGQDFLRQEKEAIKRGDTKQQIDFLPGNIDRPHTMH